MRARRHGEARAGQPRRRLGRGLLLRKVRARGVQVPGCPARRGGLRRALLHVAEVGDRVGERGEAGDQRNLGEGAVVADERGSRQQPRRPPQPVPSRGPARYPRVRRAGGAGVSVRRLAHHPAAQRGRGGVQGVRRGPGSIGDRVRITGGGAGADLLRGIARGAGGVLPDRVPLSRSEQVTGPGVLPRWRPSGGAASAGSGQRRASPRRTTPAPHPAPCRRPGRRRIR